MTDKKPLLDLSTDKTVGTVTIEDGGKKSSYGLIKINFLRVLQRDRLDALCRSLSSVSLKTAEDESKYGNVLLEMLSIIIPSASKGLLSKLPFGEKLNTINVYLKESGLIKKKVTQLTPGPRAKRKK